MTVEETTANMQQADRSSKRQCHICKRIVTGWCRHCLKAYCGPGSKDPATMTAAEKEAEERLIMSEPYELPFLALYGRVSKLEGHDLSVQEFFALERRWDLQKAKPVFKPLPAVPPPLPPPPPAPVEASRPHERPSRMQSFAHADPSAETVAAMPAVGSDPMVTQTYPIVSLPRHDQAVPETIELDAYPGTQSYHSGGTPAALAPPLPPAVTLRRQK